MSDHPRPKCRCGTVHDLRPGTKLLCTKCGMAFESYRTSDTQRHQVRAEDLRGAAIRRSPAEVLAAMKAAAAAQPKVEAGNVRPLNDRDRRIVAAREDGGSYEEIAQREGISKTRVRQLLALAEERPEP